MAHEMGLSGRRRRGAFLMLDNTAWHMTLIDLASKDCVAQRAALRALYFEGYEVTWIAERCVLPIPVVQDALMQYPMKGD